MKATTAQAREVLPLLQATARILGLSTEGRATRLSISRRHTVPYQQAGTICIPACLLTFLDNDAEAPVFVRTLAHELQHAADFYDPASGDWTREEWERRAVATEARVDNAQALALVRKWKEGLP